MLFEFDTNFELAAENTGSSGATQLMLSQHWELPVIAITGTSESLTVVTDSEGAPFLSLGYSTVLHLPVTSQNSRTQANVPSGLIHALE